MPCRRSIIPIIYCLPSSSCAENEPVTIITIRIYARSINTGAWWLRRTGRRYRWWGWLAATAWRAARRYRWWRWERWAWGWERRWWTWARTWAWTWEWWKWRAGWAKWTRTRRGRAKRTGWAWAWTDKEFNIFYTPSGKIISRNETDNIADLSTYIYFCSRRS